MQRTRDGRSGHLHDLRDPPSGPTPVEPEGLWVTVVFRSVAFPC